MEEKLEAFITQPVKKHRRLRREATGEDNSTFSLLEVLTPFDEQGMFEQKSKESSFSYLTSMIIADYILRPEKRILKLEVESYYA